MIKILWDYFPKTLKKYLFPSTILLSVFSTMTYLFISGQNISLSIPALLQLVIAFVIYSIIVIIIGLFFSYNRIIYFLYARIKDHNDRSHLLTAEKNLIIPIKEKKYIPHQFELETLNHNLVEYTVFIKRKWYPNETIPGIESFINELGFSKPRCGICHSDFYVNHGAVESVECKNPDCKNKSRVYSSDLYSVNKQIETRFKGTVRNNFHKYWEKYQNIYDEFTKKNYEDYYEPNH